MSLVLRRRIFWAFLLLGLANFLFFSSVVYGIAMYQVEFAQRRWSLPPFLQVFRFSGSATSFRDFISMQATATMLLLAFGSSVLLGNDFRFHAVSFYLSRPVRKLDYFLGKLAAAAGLCALVTLLPAVVLYLEYGLYLESMQYFRDSSRTLLAIIAYGALVSVAVGTLLLGIAAVCRKTILTVVAWGAIFAFLPIVSEIFHHVAERVGASSWPARLINLWAVLEWISDAFFGVEREGGAGRMAAALAVLGAWMAVAVAAFWMRIRGAEVVR
jgi:hypothetical protein